MLEVCLLGTGGTMPLKNRKLTSAVFRFNGSCLLIDCGEGTQIGYKENEFRFKALDVICFTHFHADHISGIIGMLLSMGNEGRTEPVDMIGPKKLEKVISSLRIIAPDLPFRINFHEITEEIQTFNIRDFGITAFAVKHIVNCFAYLVKISRVGEFSVEKAEKLPIPRQLWGVLQKKGSAEYEGVTYTSDMVLGPSRKGISVVYCTDSRPLSIISDFASGADLFICEGMHGDDDKKDKAIETGHMTFSEAATLAAEAPEPPKKMWLTHFSPSLSNPDDYLPVAQKIFSETYIGKDGLREIIKFEE